MSNYYAPCFYRIDFVVIPSYIELPWVYLLLTLNIFHKFDFEQTNVSWVYILDLAKKDLNI